MSVQISLSGMFRLILVDTLRRVHNVGFLVERLLGMRFIWIILLKQTTFVQSAADDSENIKY